MDYYSAFTAWAHAHPFVLTSAAFASAHWKLIVRAAFKIKWFRALVVGNPTEAKAWIDSLDKEVDADIDEAVAESQAHAAATAPAPAPATPA